MVTAAVNEIPMSSRIASHERFSSESNRIVVVAVISTAPINLLYVHLTYIVSYYLAENNGAGETRRKEAPLGQTERGFFCHDYLCSTLHSL